MRFEAYEREFREHLAGLMGHPGFDPARDVEAITFNRWPHGYAWASTLYSMRSLHLCRRHMAISL